MVVFAGHQCVSVSVVVGATGSTFWVEPLFQAALLPLGNGGTQEGHPASREEPGSREDSLGREPVEPGSNLPPEPDRGPKGRRVRFYDPSQARKETAVKRQLQLGGREPGLSKST